MEFNRGYKYLLEVSNEQKILLFNHIFTYNQTWNILLNQKQKEYEENLIIEEKSNKKYINLKEQDDLVKKILKGRELSFNSKVTQQCRIVFNKDFKKTIKSLGKDNTGMLKFKSSRDFNNQGFQTTKEQYSILNFNKRYKILRLFRQNFKIRWSRDFPELSDIKTITITYKNNKFYISFNVILTEDKIDTNLKKITKNMKLNSYGMDINIDSIDYGNFKDYKRLDISDIKKVNLKNKYKDKLKKLQRKQSRRILKAKKTKVKLGKNFKKTQDKINKIYQKNTDRKIYKLHEIVNEIIADLKEKNINHLVIEDLNVKKMTEKTTHKNKIKLLGKEKTKSMKKNILQISFALFVEILKYKCAYNEIYLELVAPEYTSKTCNNCGNIDNNQELSNREYSCKECGYKNPRDYNSVLNILCKSLYINVSKVKLTQGVNQAG